MKKIFHRYEQWEDYQNGMFSIEDSVVEERIQFSIELLSNDILFEESARSVISEWTKSAEENLTNIHCNRKAWLGQASCCFNHGSTERETRIAWAKMRQIDRDRANKIAGAIIDEYERKNNGLHSGLETEMLPR